MPSKTYYLYSQRYSESKYAITFIRTKIDVAGYELTDIDRAILTENFEIGTTDGADMAAQWGLLHAEQKRYDKNLVIPEMRIDKAKVEKEVSEDVNLILGDEPHFKKMMRVMVSHMGYSQGAEKGFKELYHKMGNSQIVAVGYIE